MKLYQELNEKEVLASAMNILKKTKRLLIVSKLENDPHPVQPNPSYYNLLNELKQNKVQIIRYYFGSPEGFENEQRANPDIENIYGGNQSDFQRLIISDDDKSMCKIGKQFVYSSNSHWISMLKQSLPQRPL